jgi:oligoendopeptidase F
VRHGENAILPFMKRTALLIAVALAVLTLTVGAQERDRAKVANQYTWNLADLYSSDAAWRADKEAAQAALADLRQYKSRLASSASTLADALDRFFALDKQLSRVAVYASLLADQDTRDSAHQGMRQEMSELFSRFGAESAYLEPEVLRFPQGTVARFLASEPRLKTYSFYLQDIARRAPHTLSENEEKILANRFVVGHVQHSLERGLSLSVRHPQRRQAGQDRSGRLHAASRHAEPRGPREGHVGLLHHAG